MLRGPYDLSTGKVIEVKLVDWEGDLHLEVDLDLNSIS